MRKLLLLILINLALSKCKNDVKESISPIETITGTWRLAEKQVVVNGQPVWQDITDQSPYSFTISTDGAILNGAGLPECCVPKTLSVNGVAVGIPSSSQLPSNPDCARVNCALCESWDIETSGEELIIDYCGRERAKFTKY